MNVTTQEVARMAGRLFLFGFKGAAIDHEIQSFIQRDYLSGVILFARNIETLDQVKKLNRELQHLANYPLLIGIDQEGGRVQRLKEPFFQLPPMGLLKEQYQPEALEGLGQKLGEELLRLGFNLDFAPVLDIFSNPKNSVIGNRAFGTDSDTVIQYALPFLKGLKRCVITCGKHFPGHGDTIIDSHLDLPVEQRTVAGLRKRELLPFIAGIDAGVDSMMSAHILFEQIDQYPGTLSQKILGDLLRKELAFDRVIFSDDMDMNAMKNHYDVEEMVYKGLNAGIDIFIVARNDSGQQDAMLAAAKKLIMAKEISIDQVMASFKRIDSMVQRTATF